MLNIPQPQRDESSGKPPVVDLSESRATLEPLLRLCYPFPKAPTFSSFDEAKPLLEAAHKYELAFAADMLKQAIAPFIHNEPVRVYAFAAHFHLTGLMEEAARASLFLPFPWAYNTELEKISAGVYHHLLQYREECKSALTSLSRTKWSTKEHKWTWRACTTCVKHIHHSPPNGHCGHCGEASWFSSFWEDLLARLKERPNVQTLQDPTLYSAPALKTALQCYECRVVVCEQIRKFLELLAGEAQREISAVRLKVE